MTYKEWDHQQLVEAYHERGQEIERLQRLISYYVDPYNVRPEDQAAVDAAISAAIKSEQDDD